MVRYQHWKVKSKSDIRSMFELFILKMMETTQISRSWEKTTVKWKTNPTRLVYIKKYSLEEFFSFSY